jgi:hypothetical protein
MKIPAIILLSLAVVCFIIGIHQSFFYGISNSYWLFMFMVGFLMWYKLRINDENEEEDKKEATAADKPPRKKA